MLKGLDAVPSTLTPPKERHEATILSALRYPGSKRRLAGYIKQALALNGRRPKLFVEACAGGASVSLQLLNDGMVDSIGLIDRDPFVASFWKTAFFDADWLVDQVETIGVTLDQWDQFKRQPPTDRRGRALACLFLNRTSFSGILASNAGPIGGRSQASDYKLDCRFPRRKLVKRIRQAEKLKDRVSFVWELTWKGGASRVRSMQARGSLPDDVLYYFDPPFFEKAERLYRYHFDGGDHRALRDFLVELDDPWILSYDSVQRVKELYGEVGDRAAHVELLYSTSGGAGRGAGREVILSNLPDLPDSSRLWRRVDEWHESRPAQVPLLNGRGAEPVANSHYPLPINLNGVPVAGVGAR